VASHSDAKTLTKEGKSMAAKKKAKKKKR